MEKIIKKLKEFDIRVYINKIRDLRIERIILNRELNEHIIECKSLKIKNELIER